MTNLYPIQRGFEADHPRCKVKDAVEWLAGLQAVLLFVLGSSSCMCARKLAISESRPGALAITLPQPLDVLTQTNTPQGAKSKGRLACC